MTRAIQSTQEMKILEMFREAYPAFPKGQLIKMESPDFILKVGRKRSIGIEITSLENFPGEAGLSDLKRLIGFILDKKEYKLTLYQKKRLDLYWLIITAGAERAPVRMPEKVGNWDFNTRFNKLFIFDVSKLKVYEIK